MARNTYHRQAQGQHECNNASTTLNHACLLLTYAFHDEYIVKLSCVISQTEKNAMVQNIHAQFT